MKRSSLARSAFVLVATGVAVTAAGYGALASLAWLRYGRPRLPQPDEADALLDRFMPACDVVERHHVCVAAPADVTLAAAGEMDLASSPLIAAVFKARELVLGSTRSEQEQPRGLLQQMQALGWRVLAEAPGREIVVGAVTKPWEPDVTFVGLSPESFASFAEPDYVKIAWTLRADPLGPYSSIFRTETRAVATDARARMRFRRYWSFASPGIALIRQLSLRPLRDEAERRARGLAPVRA